VNTVTAKHSNVLERIKNDQLSIMSAACDMAQENEDLQLEVSRLNNEVNALLRKQKEHIETIDTLRESHITLTRENDEMKAILGAVEQEVPA